MKVYIKTSGNLPEAPQFSSTWQEDVYVAEITEEELKYVKTLPDITILQHSQIDLSGAD